MADFRFFAEGSSSFAEIRAMGKAPSFRAA